MTAPATIRAAQPADAPAVTGMLARLATETGDGARFASTPETIRAHGFGPGALFDTLIAEAGEAAVGLALYFPHFSTIRGQPGVYLQDLWVAPEARAQGLGARLVGAVADYARAGWGAEYLALTTHPGNDAARAFYTRLGFHAQAGDVPMIVAGPAFGALTGRAEAAA
jgi:GNAT superfamily N-acetyltransferase